MTDEQLRMARALGRVRFTPASWQKRYGRQMAAWADNAPERTLSERQHAWLRWLVYRYRRQIPASVVALALGPMGHPPVNPREDPRSTAAR